MDVALYKSRASQWARERITELSHRCRDFTPEQIKDVSQGTADVVYLVPYELLLEEVWPAIRVRLAQSCRLYIVFGSSASTQEVMHAARDGAFDMVSGEDDGVRWSEAMVKAAASQNLWLQLYGGASGETDEVLIGRSPGMTNLKQAIERLGPTDATVLILGESGVGKERVAETLHKASGRGPFLAVNCAAIPKDLIEAELFGSEKGAFTGAVKARPGLVEEAAGGTLFLDEIGELELGLQPKLLRFLETRVARRVGGNKDYHVDVRVLSATNRNLEQDINEGTFRADLYFRLSEITLRIPPLRMRIEDIPLFARFFLKSAAERFGKHFDHLEPELVAKLQGYAWPGNVRELKSAIDRMVILYDGPVLRTAWWEEPAASTAGQTEASLGGMAPVGGPGASPMPSPRQKMAIAKRLLAESDQNLSWVSAQLGIHPTTLYRWRKQGKL